MALKFFNDYEKVNKTPDPTPAAPETPAAMTVDDMKAYFDTMKESLINEIKEQFKQTAAPENNSTTEKEGDTNASNTDLLNS